MASTKTDAAERRQENGSCTDWKQYRGEPVAHRPHGDLSA